MPQHFVAPPEWHWYIVWYFFLGGLAGGAYALGTLLRLVGEPRGRGRRAARLPRRLPGAAICPILLTLDLGQPHALLAHADRHAPDAGLPNFKYWSPMSVGAWVLVVFGLFATLSFVEALVLDGRLRHPLARGWPRRSAAASAGSS